MTRQQLTPRRILALMLLAVCGVAWVVPSDVVELVLRQQDVLLGRYSDSRLTGLILTTPVLLGISALLWSGTRRDRVFFYKLAATVGALVGLLVPVDAVLRATRTPRYLEQPVQAVDEWPFERVVGKVRSRPPNLQYRIRFADVPTTRRSYPDAPPGFPPADLTLTTDRRGFRNRDDLDRYDMVTLGDSFAEGSRVSDEESWVERVEERLGVSIYNLGLSGSSPHTYTNNLLAYGVALRPSTVICMFYEGNDFKVHADRKEPRLLRDNYKRIQNWVQRSPITLAFLRLVVRTFEGINADGPMPDHPALTWMPLAVGPADRTRYYSFKPKRLLRLLWEADSFRQSKGWNDTAEAALDLKRACAERGIRLIFVYAPSKPRVVLPLVRDRVRAEALHAFAAVRADDLPPPAPFERELWGRLNSQERVFREFCWDEGIEFVSPTEALREQAAEGVQVYYTYDQHWTRLGHGIVAREIADYLESSPAGLSRRLARRKLPAVSAP